MVKYPALNFPKVTLRARKADAKDMIWDDIRKLWLALTPEEWVRQHAVGFLSEECGIAKGSISIEHPVNLNSQPQRADIVAFIKDKAWMLVECKAWDVVIDRKVLDQALRYNTIIKARYIFLTNGMKHYFFEINDNIPSQIDYIPHVEQ